MVLIVFLEEGKYELGVKYTFGCGNAIHCLSRFISVIVNSKT